MSTSFFRHVLLPVVLGVVVAVLVHQTKAVELRDSVRIAEAGRSPQETASR